MFNQLQVDLLKFEKVISKANQLRLRIFWDKISRLMLAQVDRTEAFEEFDYPDDFNYFYSIFSKNYYGLQF